MHDGYSLAPLAPLIGGVVGVGLYRQRLARELRERSDAAPAAEGVRVYRYPQGILWPILLFAFGIPVAFFLLPSDVIEAGPLTYVVPSALGAVFFWGWAYCKLYRIELESNTIRYGAIWPSSIDLTKVTRISYYRINNGINLKLFSGKHRIGIFEGGIENFDSFAKSVRLRIPSEAVAEAVGEASF